MNIFYGPEDEDLPPVADFNSYDHTPAEPSDEDEEPGDVVDANGGVEALVTKLVRGKKVAKKTEEKGAKKSAKKAAKPAKKTAKKPAKAPVKAPTKKVAKKAAKTARKAGMTRAGTPYVAYESGKRRGPGAGGKLVRKGDAKYGARVAKARKAKGLSQKELAVKIGCGQPSLANIETGTVNAGDKMKAKLAKALGI